MSKYEIRKCKSCGKEFEPKRSNQVNCSANCKMIFGGGITKKGKTTTVKGVLNCCMFMRGLK